MKSNNAIGPSISGGILLVICVVALALAILNQDYSLSRELREQRMSRLQSLTPLEKQHLLRQKERFDRMDPESRAELREFHRRLSEASNSERLTEVMQRYGQWISALPSRERAELLSHDLATRVESVQELLTQEEEERFKQLLEVELEDKDLTKICNWLNEFVAKHDGWVEKHWDPIVASLSEDQQRWFCRIQGEARRRRHLIIQNFHHPERYTNLPQGVPTPGAGDFEQLAADLSNKANEILNSASAGEERRRLVSNWTQAAWFSKYFPKVEKGELERFFREDLEDEKREYLERLSGERFQHKLRFYYHLHQRRLNEAKRKGSRSKRSRKNDNCDRND